MLKQMIDNTGSVYMVLDSLDECEEMDSLLEGLGDGRRWNQTNLHILTTSRPDPDIEDSLSTLMTEKFP